MIEITHKHSGSILRRFDLDTLVGADLRGVDLSNSNLSHWDLTNSVLTHADLSRADLHGAILRGADVRHANLEGADLGQANLVATNLYCANLTQADLRAANLQNADLQGAVLCQADLARAALANTNLTGTNLGGASLEGIRWDSTTQWPDDLQPTNAEGGASWGATRKDQFRRAHARRVGKAGPETIRLWTIQELPVWERLRRCKVLYVDPGCIDPSYLRAYEWMQEQMLRRMPDAAGHFPWWAWLRPKPDLRTWHSRCFPPGSRRVRLELAIPEPRILLSDYSSWHMILYRGYVAVDRAEREAWEAELAQSGIDDCAWPLPEP